MKLNMNNDIGFCCLNLAVCIESTSIYMFQKQNFSMLKNSLYKANRKLEDSIKINRPIYNIRMYWTNFWQPIIHIYSQQNIFENTLLKIYSPHLYASFDTFCVQIGQSFEAQWVFEVCLKIGKSPLSNLKFFRIFKDPLRL